MGRMKTWILNNYRGKVEGLNGAIVNAYGFDNPYGIYVFFRFRLYLRVAWWLRRKIPVLEPAIDRLNKKLHALDEIIFGIGY